MKQTLLIIKKGEDKAIREGYPWIYASQVQSSSALELLEPGEIVTIADFKGKPFAMGYYNVRSVIACRVLALKPDTVIDKAFFVYRLQAALKKRASIPVPYYRLVHSEGDFLPGLVLDRFGSRLVCQVSTAGMERHLETLIEAIREVLPEVDTVLLRGDVPSREKEGIPRYVRLAFGEEIPPLIEVQEYDTIYYADLVHGQKTGWFYDQRENRRHIAELTTAKTNMLDVYCHSGGFGLAVAKAGAASVTFVDSSALALSLAEKAAVRNGVEACCTFMEGKAFDVLEELGKKPERFEIVVVDPPAFAKQQQNKMAALKGYEKLVKLAVPLVKPGGVLLLASCSHHVPTQALAKIMQKAIENSGQKYTKLRIAGAASDHSVHPKLKENEYLKAITMRVG
ncbi:MAG: putative SAM-dependent methyltransferase [Rickettsiales bacterium]|jgi:23S rRNA (cytosine1962-C5)-methyltransferase|nr:putative SAM-dependent methyltransferase [Rickettsiales bacterium]